MFIHLPRPEFVEPVAVTLKSGDRFYTTPKGKRYPSVTTILKLHSRDAIQKWRKRVGKEEAALVGARAGARGNRIHGLMEKTLMNQPVSPKLMDLEMYKLMLKHVQRINNIRLLEAALYSDELRLAGRSDCVAEFDGELSIIDFKTSLKKKKKEWVTGYCMQVCAYAVMFEELFGIPVKKGVIIMGVDDEKPQVFKVNVEDWLEELLHYRDQWEAEARS